MNKIYKSRFPLILIKYGDRLKYLFHFFKNASLKSQNKLSPLLIVGCGRSGNTLLRSMLVAGGEVVIPPESYVWPRVIRKYSSLSYLGWETVSKLIIAEIEGNEEFYTWNTSFTELYSKVVLFDKNDRSLADILNLVYKTYAEKINKNAVLWGDKTPINTIYLRKILKVYPEAKVIHIVRDPRDVVASYVKSGLYSDPVEAAKFWSACINEVSRVKALRGKDFIFELRYEDLVRTPENELKNVCSFIGITYKEEMLNFYKKFDSLGDTLSHKHHENLKNPLNTTAIGKGRQFLTPIQLKMIEKLLEKHLKQLNY